MDLAFYANTARLVEITLTDGSLAYGVDLFENLGDVDSPDLGDTYVHVDCIDKDDAEVLVKAFRSIGCPRLPDASRTQ